MTRTTLITGAGRGLGAAIAVELGRRGDHVVVNHRTSSASAAAVVEQVVRAGGSATAVRADVTDPLAVDAMIAALDRLDAVVINANTAPPPFAALADLEWPAFAAKITGELAGAFHVVKRAMGVMRGQGGGALVFVGSTAADYVGGGRLAHGTAKAALATFARHVAAEGARDGVSVVTVAPGAVRSSSTAHLLDDERAALLARESVLGRVLEPRDVALAVAAALDPALRPATGTTIRLDGGWSVLVGGPTS